VHDVYHPQTGELIVTSGVNINEDIASVIASSPIEEVEIRSVLTCEHETRRLRQVLRSQPGHRSYGAAR
jgi:hypothetical protein